MCFFFTTLAGLLEPGKFYPGSCSLMISLADSIQCPILVGGLGQMGKPIQLWHVRLSGCLSRASGWYHSLPVGWWHLGHVRRTNGDAMQAGLCLLYGLSSVNCNTSPLLGLLGSHGGKNLPGKNHTPFACFPEEQLGHRTKSVGFVEV